MKRTLLKSATIIHPEYTASQKQDILIDENGVIIQLADNITDETASVISSNDLHVSAGWLDIGTHVGEPGFEYKDDFFSIEKAALAGGFTAIAPFPNTDPIVNHRSHVENIVHKSERSYIDILPISALSKNCKGNEITEMMDMSDAGAVAFSNGINPTKTGGELLRALLYTKGFGGVVVQFPLDFSVVEKGMVHEGINSTQIGVKGIPTIAETICVQRDLSVLAYTEGKLMLHNLSLAESVEMAEKAKADGLTVFTGINSMNLALNDNEILSFDSNIKVMPPLRAAKDQDNLITAVKAGKVDYICSNHLGQSDEEKKVEFGAAEFGAINLQTTFSSSLNALGSDQVEQIINLLCYSPRQILNQAIPNITVGDKANITLFDPSQKSTFSLTNNHSKSTNSPFIDQALQGTVIGTIHKGNTTINA